MFRSFFYLISSTAAKAVNGLIVLKLIAVYGGVNSFGILSQLMGIIALFGMLAAGGIGNGLIRQLAATQSSHQRASILKASLTILTTISILLGIAIIATAWPIANWLLTDNQVSVLLLLALAQAVVGAGTLAQSIAIANGRQLWIMKISITAAVLGALSVYFSLKIWGVIGASFALVVNAAMPGFVTIISEMKTLRRWRIALKSIPVERDQIITLLNFAGVTLIGALSITLSQLATRHWIGETLGWTVVGLWQAVTRLSDVTMQIVAVLLAGYVLPNLSKHMGRDAMNRALIKFTSILLGGMLLTSAITLIFRENVIVLFFSREFLPSVSMMPIQLAGDQMRTVAVCISTAFLAQGTPRIPLAYEFSQGLLLIAFTVGFTGITGINAPVYAHLTSYTLLAVALLALWFYRVNLSESK